MKLKPLMLCAVLACLLIVASVSCVHASFAASPIYTFFNSATHTNYDMGESDWLTVWFSNKMTMNASHVAIVQFGNSTGSMLGIQFQLFSNKICDVIYVNGAGNTKIAETTLGTLNDSIELDCSSDSLSVYVNDVALIEGFSMQNNWQYCAVYGATGTATGGYMQISTNGVGGGSSGALGMTSAITQWLPVIIQFVMLGMVIGILKKFGRW